MTHIPSKIPVLSMQGWPKWLGKFPDITITSGFEANYPDQKIVNPFLRKNVNQDLRYHQQT